MMNDGDWDEVRIFYADAVYVKTQNCRDMALAA